MAKKQQGYNPLDLTNEELRLRSKRMRKGTEAIKNRMETFVFQWGLKIVLMKLLKREL